MSVEKMNDAAILSQLDSHWIHITTALVHKFAKKGETIFITTEDLKALQEAWPGGAILPTTGFHDQIGLRLVTPEEAKVAAEHDAKLRGQR